MKEDDGFPKFLEAELTHPSAVFWEVAEKLYHEADGCKIDGEKIGELPLVTYPELRKAFLPKRTFKDVAAVGDKIAVSGSEMIANSDLFDFSTPPSCRAIGLDSGFSEEFASCDIVDIETGEIVERAIAEDKAGKIILSCSCPDGYAEYTPEEYARAHVVKCLKGKQHMHYSDFPKQFANLLWAYYDAKKNRDVSEMVIALDGMIHAVHGSGPLAEYFVEGGKATLEKLKWE